jgi:hypothetical protein
LAQGHYFNAALMSLPDAVEEQLEMARRFLTSRGGYTLPARQSTYRVSAKIWQKARDLDMEMTAAAKRGLVVFLFSAAMEKFLDDLGDLPLPVPTHVRATARGPVPQAVRRLCTATCLSVRTVICSTARADIRADP